MNKKFLPLYERRGRASVKDSDVKMQEMDPMGLLQGLPTDHRSTPNRVQICCP